MSTAIFLIGLGIVWRLAIAYQLFETLGIGTPYNLVPIGAIALYAGARVPRRWAFAVPLAVLVLSDLLIDPFHGYPFYFTSRLTTYALFTAIVGLGLLARNRTNPFKLAALSLTTSVTFFLVSNFAVWLGREGFAFPMTWEGLLSTYAVALPFLQNSVIGDLVGTAVLFYLLDGVLSRSTSSDVSTEASVATK